MDDLEPTPRDPARVLARFTADRQAYIVGHITLAILGSILASAALVFMGTGNVWVGPVGAILAVAVRGFYLASEELAVTWDLTPVALVCSDSRTVPLADIVKIRRISSAVQVITRKGDKYLIKHQRDPDATWMRIEQAAGLQRQ